MKMPCVSMIYASASNCVIGAHGQLPWDLPEELANFKNITKNNVVVMGRVTWDSIGARALVNRINIVISSRSGDIVGKPDLVTSNIVEAIQFAKQNYPSREIFVIGGARLFEVVLQCIQLDRIYVSKVDKSATGETVFFNSADFRLDSFKQRLGFQYLIYSPSARGNEQQYISLLRDIVDFGETLEDRTKVGTRCLFGKTIEFNLQESFPLLTTKKMAWRAIQKELYFFLGGRTNTKELESAGVHIWRDNTSREFLEANGLGHYTDGEMGPMYGHQWRNFGGTNFDQLRNIMAELKRNPNSRRLVMTTFNPAQADEGVLWPCHGIVLQFFCSSNRLSALMYQRSADVFLGLPFNIASYSLLVHLIARHVNMIPDRLIISIGNAHIYNNHTDAAKEQLSRKPLIAPQLEIIRDVQFEDFSRLDESWVKLWGYFYYPRIVAKMAV